MNKNSRIYVAGHTGMVGSAIIRKLRQQGYDNIYIPAIRYDLRKNIDVKFLFEHQKIEYVFCAAAKVGGIQANNNNPADFIRDNILIQTNLMNKSLYSNVKKFLFLGSSCIYPKCCPQPIKEDYLLTGPLEETNYGYAIAKIAGIKMAQAYRDQYDFNAISIMPCNLYGPGDNFNLNNSHVLAALLRKAYEYKHYNINEFVVWGSGSPLREFMHVDDLADACIFLMNNYNEREIINVGTGNDISIYDLSKLILKIVNIKENHIIFDDSKPDGMYRKLLDVSKIHKLGWHHQIDLEKGIKKTYSWLCKNYYRDARL